MAGVARLASELGYAVSGSDDSCWPPMDAQIRDAKVDFYRGYDAAVEDRPADCYLIGNAVSRGNPLVESILDSGRDFDSGPAFVARAAMRDRAVVAVAGTHGKTTTAAALAWILERAGESPGFLIGGVAPNFGVSARLGGASSPFVFEADEYDSAFFDKRPKFLHCRPRVALVNNLQFDHADIYPDIDSLILQFHYLFRAVARSGTLVLRARDANIRKALARGAYSPRAYFGPLDEPEENGGERSPLGDFHWRFKKGEKGEKGEMAIVGGGESPVCFAPPLPGAMNRDNLTAAIVCARALGVPVARAAAALADFRPPLRRLQLVARPGGISLYDDFAHHPTACRETVAALRESSPARILAVFEPRSNTMRAGVWAEDLAAAFADADLVFACRGETKWDLEKSLAPLNRDRRRAFVFDSVAEIAPAVAAAARAGDAVLLMSNGDFGGVGGQIAAAIEKLQLDKKR